MSIIHTHTHTHTHTHKHTHTHAYIIYIYIYIYIVCVCVFLLHSCTFSEDARSFFTFPPPFFFPGRLRWGYSLVLFTMLIGCLVRFADHSASILWILPQVSRSLYLSLSVPLSLSPSVPLFLSLAPSLPLSLSPSLLQYARPRLLLRHAFYFFFPTFFCSTFFSPRMLGLPYDLTCVLYSIQYSTGV
jgi:hypothetical protein